MTSISQESGDIAGDIDLSITGTGFTNEDDTLIQIGDKLMICQPTSMSAILINCTVQQPEAGIYPVYVFTKSKGEAVYPVGGLEVDVPLTITGIVPTTGSLGGGTILTVTGSLKRTQYLFRFIHFYETYIGSYASMHMHFK